MNTRLDDSCRVLAHGMFYTNTVLRDSDQKKSIPLVIFVNEEQF